MTGPMLELIGVYKAFGAQAVLRGVDLCVPRRTTYALLGVSGSGKTVLLKHVIGLLHPDRGVVRVDGQDLAACSAHELEAVHRKFGVLFQSGALLDSLTVFDNLARGRSSKRQRRRSFGNLATRRWSPSFTSGSRRDGSRAATARLFSPERHPAGRA